MGGWGADGFERVQKIRPPFVEAVGEDGEGW